MNYKKIATRLLLGGTILALTAGTVFYQRNKEFFNSRIDFSRADYKIVQTTTDEPPVQQRRGRTHGIFIAGNNGNTNCCEYHRRTSEAQDLIFRLHTTAASEGMARLGLDIQTRLDTVGKNEGYNFGATTRENILLALEHHAEQSQPGDVLFFYYSGHGSNDPETGEAGLTPNGDEYIYPRDIREALEEGQFNYQVMNFACCYGGDIAKALGIDNTIAISSGAPGKVSYTRLPRLDTFQEQLLFAILGKDLEDNPRPVNSDLNFDGNLTIEEIFMFAAINNPYTPMRIAERERRRGNLNPFAYVMGADIPHMFYERADPSRLSFPEDPEENKKGNVVTRFFGRIGRGIKGLFTK